MPPAEDRLPLAGLEVNRQYIAAMIALWIAIHGGDPVPTEVKVDDTGLLIAAALDRHLATTIEGFGAEARSEAHVHRRMKSLGIEVLGDGESREEWICFCIRLIYFNVDRTRRDPEGDTEALVICVCFRA